MSLTNSGKLFSWGYKGKGLLGRKVVGNDFAIGYQLSPKKEIKGSFNLSLTEFLKEFYEDKEEDQGQGKGTKKLVQRYFIKQVVCMHHNTVALTNVGEVLVLGSNNYS